MSASPRAAPTEALSGLFFASGVAGLLYQVCWQRLLFVAFGSDLPSVTIIVAAFMSGLGLGALAGGAAADRWPVHAAALFCGCEAGIGLFGVVSPNVLLVAGDYFVAAPGVVVAAVNFAIVLVPAFLMGATLPILVSHLARHLGNVGQATGQLYAANTLGACIGALLPAFVLLDHLPVSAVIRGAAVVNLAVALLTWRWLRRLQGDFAPVVGVP
ncbi:MAG: hypothetical protein EXR79_13475 [Myxococcales bacterium]|nr:hypothetical protein [Myxococcales bacterium]